MGQETSPAPKTAEVTSDPYLAVMTRIAVALEKWVLHAFGEDLNPEVLSMEEERALITRDDNQSFVDEETMAVVELIETSGRDLPLEVYERLHIDPPSKREQSIDTTSFDADQPGARSVDDEIRDYKKKINGL